MINILISILNLIFTLCLLGLAMVFFYDNDFTHGLATLAMVALFEIAEKLE